jgi:hypothetical protein
VIRVVPRCLLSFIVTRMPYSRAEWDRRIRFVSSAVCTPGQSSSGTIVILCLGGAGLVTCVGLVAEAVGVRAAMAPYVGVGATVDTEVVSLPRSLQFRRFCSRLSGVDLSLMRVPARWTAGCLNLSE